MKRLFLVRHAKSSWKHLELDDIDRPLNKRGKGDAPFMGKLLRRYDVMPDLLITSPAKRAVTTAKLFAKELEYPRAQIVVEKNLYLADVQGLLEIVGRIDRRYNDVMMFGHNPGLTLLANHCTGHDLDNIPTCGVFCVSFDGETWEHAARSKGTFVFFEYPKKHL